MGGLFKTPAKPKMPPVPPPAPIPEVGPEPEEGAVRRARKRRGWESTILTGALEPTSTGKKTSLG